MVHTAIGRLVGIAALLMASGLRAEPAAEFTADLVQSQDGMVKRGKIHVSGAKYRMELPQNDGPDVVLIVDPGKDIARVLVPRYAMYVETEATDGRVLMHDPFGAMRRTAGRYEKKVEGEESWAGHPCRRELIHYEEQPVMTCWVSTELGWPLRILMAQPDETWVRLENVTKGAVDPALMATPEDYAQADWEQLFEKLSNDEEMVAKAEEWKRNRPRKGEFSRRLATGSEARILLGEAVSARAEVRYGSGEPYRWALVPMRDGKELRPAADCVLEGSGKAEWLAGLEPDTLVARGLEGEANLSITLRGRPPLAVATWEAYDQQQRGGRSWSPQLREWKHVKITFTATQEEGVARGMFKVSHGARGSTETREHPLALEPGQSMTLEWSSGDGPIQDFDMMLQTGRLRIEVVEDTREDGDRSPF